ncbi:MAG: MFS transporter [Candidatus Omnitrophica bacterium]|nr:MFS transporter [Candidatus Omnitrophota bacterium]
MSIFRALHYKNYRLFFSGQVISLIGTWMQQVALSWLVYRLTNSALLLGVVGFFSQLPGLLFTVFAGVIADRYNRHRMLIVTQSLAMVQAFVLSILVLTNTIQIWHIVLLSTLLGLVNAFDIPIRQSFTIEMIDRKEDLGNAIALNSSIFNMARLIGPSIAGIIIAVAGEGVCFLINALSYLAVIASLMMMTIHKRKPKSRETHILEELREGWRYTFGFGPIRAILLLLATVSMIGVPYQILMPVFARDILHGGPRTLGFLMAMAGIGALAGALFLARRKSVLGLEKMIAGAACIFGIGITIFSFSRVVGLSMLIILFCGFGIMIQMASSNTILQTIVDEDKRGRIMSFYTLAFTGMVPFGSLFAGGVASKIGAPSTLLISGLLCIIASCLFARKLPALRKEMHPVYVRKGIIPEVATGLQATTRL